MAKENRFEVVYTQDVGFMGAVRILRDTQTGVEYLFTMVRQRRRPDAAAGGGRHACRPARLTAQSLCAARREERERREMRHDPAGIYL